MNYTPQSPVLDVPEVHESHVMEFRPCLFLECTKCGTTAKHGAKELRAACEAMDFGFMDKVAR